VRKGRMENEKEKEKEKEKGERGTGKWEVGSGK
jgi:hypothetical protein